MSGGIHAREWIAPAATSYVLTRLLETYATDNSTRTVVDRFELVFAPCVNPDGYTFSRTDDRLWRKNRRPASANGGQCAGVDLNRNFANQYVSRLAPFGGACAHTSSAHVGACAAPHLLRSVGAAWARRPTRVRPTFAGPLRRRSQRRRRCRRSCSP